MTSLRCTCEWEDDGDAENGPHVSIVELDEACPLHGRAANPVEWERAERHAIEYDAFMRAEFVDRAQSGRVDVDHAPMPDATYAVRRFYFDEQHPDHQRVLRTGLSLSDAQAHCRDDASCERDDHGHVVWFDGYDEEER